MKQLNDDLDICLAYIIGHEGEYSDLKNDKGGPTMYGIASNYNPLYAAQIRSRALSLDDAFKIYRTKYSQSSMTKAADNLKKLYLSLDVAIWGGLSLRSIQRAMNTMFNDNIKDDGIFGPQTLRLWSALHSNEDMMVLGAILYKNAQLDAEQHARIAGQPNLINGILRRYKLRAGTLLSKFGASFPYGTFVSYSDLRSFAQRLERTNFSKVANATYAAFMSKGVDMTQQYKEVVV